MTAMTICGLHPNTQENPPPPSPFCLAVLNVPVLSNTRLSRRSGGGGIPIAKPIGVELLLLLAFSAVAYICKQNQMVSGTSLSFCQQTSYFCRHLHLAKDEMLCPAQHVPVSANSFLDFLQLCWSALSLELQGWIQRTPLT